MINLVGDMEVNLWLQYHATFIAQHKMLPDEAAQCADKCIEMFRQRKAIIHEAARA